MPRGDGTGPFGQGPGTGRGMGRGRGRGMAGWVELVRELDPLANASVQPVTIPIPEVDEAKCTRCGKCAEVCAYNAIAAIKDKVGSDFCVLVAEPTPFGLSDLREIANG